MRARRRMPSAEWFLLAAVLTAFAFLGVLAVRASRDWQDAIMQDSAAQF